MLKKKKKAREQEEVERKKKKKMNHSVIDTNDIFRKERVRIEQTQTRLIGVPIAAVEKMPDESNDSLNEPTIKLVTFNDYYNFQYRVVVEALSKMSAERSFHELFNPIACQMTKFKIEFNNQCNTYLKKHKNSSRKDFSENDDMQLHNKSLLDENGNSGIYFNTKKVDRIISIATRDKAEIVDNICNFINNYNAQYNSNAQYDHDYAVGNQYSAQSNNTLFSLHESQSNTIPGKSSSDTPIHILPMYHVYPVTEICTQPKSSSAIMKAFNSILEATNENTIKGSVFNSPLKSTLDSRLTFVNLETVINTYNNLSQNGKPIAMDFVIRYLMITNSGEGYYGENSLLSKLEELDRYAGNPYDKMINTSLEFDLLVKGLVIVVKNFEVLIQTAFHHDYKAFDVLRLIHLIETGDYPCWLVVLHDGNSNDRLKMADHSNNFYSHREKLSKSIVAKTIYISSPSENERKTKIFKGLLEVLKNNKNYLYNLNLAIKKKMGKGSLDIGREKMDTFIFWPFMPINNIKKPFENVLINYKDSVRPKANKVQKKPSQPPPNNELSQIGNSSQRSFHTNKSTEEQLKMSEFSEMQPFIDVEPSAHLNESSTMIMNSQNDCTDTSQKDNFSQKGESNNQGFKLYPDLMNEEVEEIKKADDPVDECLLLIHDEILDFVKKPSNTPFDQRIIPDPIIDEFLKLNDGYLAMLSQYANYAIYDDIQRAIEKRMLDFIMSETESRIGTKEKIYGKTFSSIELNFSFPSFLLKSASGVSDLQFSWVYSPIEFKTEKETENNLSVLYGKSANYNNPTETPNLKKRKYEY